MRKKKVMLFFKRSARYLLILLILLAITIHLLQSAYNMAQKITLNQSSQKLSEGIKALETQAKNLQEISGILLQKKEYQNLLLVKEVTAVQSYMDIYELQKMLSALCLPQDNIVNASILFRNNSIYISNYINSDTYKKVYPTFLNYEGKSAEEWYNEVFKDNFTVKILPSHNIFVSHYSAMYFKGLTYLINASQYNGIDQSSILACVIDANHIVDSMLFKDQQLKDFIYITDRNDNIVFAHNYKDRKSLGNVTNLSEVRIDSDKYVLLMDTSSKLGLTAVVGIPRELFQDNVKSMVNILITYSLIGIVLIFLISLFFSFREAVSVGNLVETASKSSSLEFNHNEYSYINNAIKQISSTNEEQLRKIEILNNSIKACIIENLFLYGVYTQKEEKDIISYFNRDFNYFCVAILNFETNESETVFHSIRHNITLNIENSLKTIINNEYIALNLKPNESVFLIFFDESDYCDIGILKSELTELITQVAGKTAIPITIQIGLSNIVSKVKSVRNAYLQAKDALQINRSGAVSGVYLYNSPRTISQKKIFDIALLHKCYDVIMSGDKTVVQQIFCDIKNSFKTLKLSQQEQLQIFFSLRQTVCNSYLELSAGYENVNGEVGLILPEYEPLESVENLHNRLMEFALCLCDKVLSNRKSKNDKLKDDIIDYIHNNCADQNLSAAQIASALLISEKYVFSLIKEHTGKSLGRYIEDLRVSNAEQMLLNSDCSNSVISVKCGFGSENTFYRAFSKKHGVSPTTWRRNNQV